MVGFCKQLETKPDAEQLWSGSKMFAIQKVFLQILRKAEFVK